MSRAKVAAVAAAAVTAAALAAAGCGGTATKQPPPSPTSSPAMSSPSTSPATSPPAQGRVAHVGDTFTIKAEDGTIYDVTLLNFAQQASPGGEFETPSPSKHLAAAEFRISASTKVDEDANNNATAVGDNQQIYTPSALSVAEGTNFDYGQIRLQPGASSIGWVSYEIPYGVTVTKVVWTASSGFSSATCEWLVPSSSSPSPGQALDPAATVRAYFAAISAHNWPLAWKLGGQNTGTTYDDFVRGHSSTANVTVTILAVTGDVVTARIIGVDTEGTARTFEGTYTVHNGVIIHINVHEVA